VLVMGALLFIRTLYNLTTLDMGFRGRDVVSIQLTHPSLAGVGSESSALRRVIRERLSALPDVRVATEVWNPPLGSRLWNEFIWVGQSETKVVSNFNRVGDDYFTALGIPLVAGRAFDERDTPGSIRVAIVNETFASRYAPSGNAIGRTVRVEAAMGQPEPKYEIVGVVKDTRYGDLRDAIDPLVYLSTSQGEDQGRAATFILTPRTGVDRLTASVTRAIQDVNPAISLEFTLLERSIQSSLVRERLMAILSAAFGVLAGLIAAIGLYGLMSYTVARRSNEIAIRLALGATPARLLGMVLGDAGLHVAAGLTVGVALAVAAGRWVQALLYGLTPNDVTTLLIATGLLGAIGFLATLAPALRATRVDPVSSLRED
jgi:putative ABC transport system permease protein